MGCAERGDAPTKIAATNKPSKSFEVMQTVCKRGKFSASKIYVGMQPQLFRASQIAMMIMKNLELRRVADFCDQFKAIFKWRKIRVAVFNLAFHERQIKIGASRQ